MQAVFNICIYRFFQSKQDQFYFCDIIDVIWGGVQKDRVGQSHHHQKHCLEELFKMACISAMAQLPLPHDYAITSIALYRLVGTLYISDDLLMGQDQLPRQLGSRGLQTWECQESRKHS